MTPTHPPPIFGEKYFMFLFVSKNHLNGENAEKPMKWDVKSKGTPSESNTGLCGKNSQTEKGGSDLIPLVYAYSCMGTP